MALCLVKCDIIVLKVDIPNFSARGSIVVKALGYKPEGCGFET
jgi:hypothetical protein